MTLEIRARRTGLSRMRHTRIRGRRFDLGAHHPDALLAQCLFDHVDLRQAVRERAIAAPAQHRLHHHRAARQFEVEHLPALRTRQPRKRIGPGTSRLYEAAAGDRLSVLGPLGRPFATVDVGAVLLADDGNFTVAKIVTTCGVLRKSSSALADLAEVSAREVPAGSSTSVTNWGMALSRSSQARQS